MRKLSSAASHTIIAGHALKLGCADSAFIFESNVPYSCAPRPPAFALGAGGNLTFAVGLVCCRVSNDPLPGEDGYLQTVRGFPFGCVAWLRLTSGSACAAGSAVV